MALLRWALVALVVALIAALFGFTNIAAGAADVARILFFVFLALCVVLVLAGAFTYRAIAGPPS